MFRDPFDALLLGGVYGISGLPDRRSLGSPGFYLYKDQGAVLHGDDIDFTQSAAPISVPDIVAGSKQQLDRRCFAAAADFEVRRPRL